jgi:hypothetical protein
MSPRAYPLALPLLCTLLAGPACREEPAAPAAPQPPPVQAKLIPAADLADPQMADRVGKPGLPKASAAPERFLGRWVLKPGKTRGYRYTQEALASSKVADEERTQRLQVTGFLTVEPKGAASADVVLQDAQATVVATNPGADPRAQEQKLEPKVYEELLRTNKQEKDPEDPLVLAMLSVPGSELGVGERTEEILRMPFHTGGTTLWAEGALTTTLVGFVACGKSTCAHLAREIDVTEVEMPEGVAGTFTVRVKSTGWTLFDLDDGSVLQHKSATHIRLGADVPAPALEGQPSSQPADPAKVDMRQEHLHEILRQ